MTKQPEQLSFEEMLSGFDGVNNEINALSDVVLPRSDDSLTHLSLLEMLINQELLFLAKSCRSIGTDRLNKIGLAVMRLEQAKTEIVKRNRLKNGGDGELPQSPSRVEVVLIQAENGQRKG